MHPAAFSEPGATPHTKLEARRSRYISMLEVFRAALVTHAAEAQEIVDTSRLMRGPKETTNQTIKDGFNDVREHARQNALEYVARINESAHIIEGVLTQLRASGDPDMVRHGVLAVCDPLDAGAIMKDIA
eukprot:gnl/Chilomastix_cuspidata/8262.p1 GENE.gnl/Chilomastix_cuspidata/8262~~gnl/Chilomastix_cuspidata/8262.p1  ORF type:complete len:130 (-),score=6.99 gnl/Chilomastix_cuspidata/8262:81-470(-)